MHWATRRFCLLILFACLFATAGSVATAYADWLLPEQRLTTHPAIQSAVELSGNRLLYKDYRNRSEVGDPNDPTELYDIRVLDVVTKVDRLLTSQHRAVGSAAISGDYVVWEDYGTSTRQGGIYLYDLKKNTSRRLPIQSGRELAISGDRITYEAYRGGWKIYVFDISSNTEKRVTSAASYAAGAPDISGTNVVWQDFRNGNHDIYMFDLRSNKESQITTDTAGQTIPKISGNRIVWIDERNAPLNWDIYLHDLSTRQERQITTDPDLQWFPSISGMRVVWQDQRSGDFDVYLYDLTAGLEKRITATSGLNGRPTINGTRIVYDSIRDGNQDVYLTQIAVPKLAVKAPSSVGFNAAAKVIGALTSVAGTGAVGKPVTLQYSSDEIHWASGEATTTGAFGSFVLHSPLLTRARYVRVIFAGDEDYPSSTSSALLVKPRILFSDAPRFSAYSQTYGRAYTVWGYIKPKHTTGLEQIRIKAYRRTRHTDGTYSYVFKRSYTTTISNPSGSSWSKYKGRATLPSTGRWRLRAYHAEDSKNATSYSSYRYVTVEWDK